MYTLQAYVESQTVQNGGVLYSYIEMSYLTRLLWINGCAAGGRTKGTEESEEGISYRTCSLMIMCDYLSKALCLKYPCRHDIAQHCDMKFSTKVIYLPKVSTWFS